MNAYKTEVVLSEEGRLSLHDLPFHVGETVEVIVLETAKNGHSSTATNGSASNRFEDDSMYRIEELIANLPNNDTAPTDFAENHDLYIHGRVLDGQ